ncbi:hypothetical protein [Cellulomonas alba]|uniref:Uncharacterized protein n=1 Tax=Cellulomonas alba TaxID=3053467 RepID=A0ABT7SBA0_9CELL|nr:hypothetical protein [Cellulomonas alba]MDM7853462.1 hypothetical protein [Cellulomonas alba]
MLDLAGSTRTVAGVTVAPDVDDPARFLVVPATPRVDVGAAGPDLQLLRFVTGGALTGGYLRMGVSLAVDDAAVDAATAALTDEAGRPVVLAPLPVLSGAADLTFFGRADPQPGVVSPIVRTTYGSAVLGFAAPHRAAFAVTLTADGVRMVEAGLRAGALPVGVTCRYVVEGLWPAVHVVARVDWSAVYDYVSSTYELGLLLFREQVDHLVQQLQQKSAVSVTVVRSDAAGTDPATTSAAVAAALDFVQTTLLDRLCEPVLPFGTDAAGAVGDSATQLALGAAYRVTALHLTESETDVFDLSQARVQTRTLTAQASLGALLGATDPGAVIVDAGADDPFFSRFHLDVTTARPPGDLGVAAVVLDVRYGSQDGPIRLTPDEPTGSFECFADASPDRSYVLAARVQLAPDSPVDPGAEVDLPPVHDTARQVTLDLEAALGLVRLDLEGPADDRVVASAVTVTHRRGDAALASRDVALTAARRAGTATFRDHRDGDRLVVGGVHQLADGRQVPIPDVPVETSVYRLPDPYAGSITVLVTTDTTWTDLTAVVVALAKDETAQPATLAFAAPGSQAVALDQTDPTDRSYRFRVTRTAGGVTTTDDWRTSDAPVLAVGEVQTGDLVVDIMPVGPELTSAGLRTITVELVYVDVAHQVRDEHTVVIAARADTFRWDVHLADPTLRDYQYRVTRQLLTGEVRAGPWVDGHDALLPVPVTAT